MFTKMRKVLLCLHRRFDNSDHGDLDMSARYIKIKSLCPDILGPAVGIRSSFPLGKLHVVKFDQVSVFTFLDCSNTSVIIGNA